MEQRKSQTIRLIIMIVLTFSFFVVELVVGYVTGSLALISDSYHMLSDCIALFIGLACVRVRSHRHHGHYHCRRCHNRMINSFNP